MSPSTYRAGRVVSVNTSSRKGVAKEPVAEVRLRPDHGVVGDAHSGPGLRQVSLLAAESIEKQRRVFEQRQARGQLPGQCNKDYDVSLELRPGSFAENLTIEGLPLPRLPLGTRLQVGGEVELEISQIGKKCHVGCAIFELLGDCVMPREGVFATVVTGGVVRPGDEVRVDEGGRSDHK